MKNRKDLKKENLVKYFAGGIVTAVILFIVFSLLIPDKNEEQVNIDIKHIWSPEMDSLFVKNCYEKYKPQVKDDLHKQENMKGFCRCMLEKIKTKYDEKEMNRVSDKDIKQWDLECREKMLNPNNIKVK